MIRASRSANTFAHLGLAVAALNIALLVGCAMPQKSAQQAAAPAPAPQPVAITTPPAPAAAPAKPVAKEKVLDARTIKSAIKAGKDEALVGKTATLKMKNPGNGGYMDVDRKQALFGKCVSGTGNYKTGTVTGAYSGYEDFDGEDPALVIQLKNCRSG